MKFNRNIQIEKAAAKEPGRYAMHNVKFERDSSIGGPALIATDGRILAIVPVEAEEHDTDGLIPRDAFSEARKFKGARSEDTVTIGANGSVTFKGKAGDVSMPRDTEGEFPRYACIIPKDTDGRISISFNPEYLLALAKALGMKPEAPCVKLSIGKRDEPILVYAGDACVTMSEDGETVISSRKSIGALMPITID